MTSAVPTTPTLNGTNTYGTSYTTSDTGLSASNTNLGGSGSGLTISVTALYGDFTVNTGVDQTVYGSGRTFAANQYVSAWGGQASPVGGGTIDSKIVSQVSGSAGTTGQYAITPATANLTGQFAQNTEAGGGTQFSIDLASVPQVVPTYIVGNVFINNMTITGAVQNNEIFNLIYLTSPFTFANNLIDAIGTNHCTNQDGGAVGPTGSAVITPNNYVFYTTGSGGVYNKPLSAVPDASSSSGACYAGNG